MEASFALEYIDTLPDDHDLGAEVAEDILRAIMATGRNDFETPELGADFPSNSLGCFRNHIAVVAEARGLAAKAVVKAALAELEEVTQLALGAEWRVEQVRTKLAERAEREARAQLPGDDDYAKLLRYKRSHERSIDKLIDRLETSQRARAGDLPPPIRLQVSASD